VDISTYLLYFAQFATDSHHIFSCNFIFFIPCFTDVHTYILHIDRFLYLTLRSFIYISRFLML